jgi:DNA invertase Pin-like site-specific DNA recombinase
MHATYSKKAMANAIKAIAANLKKRKKVNYGYARVSTSEQETTLQLDALKKVGVKKIYQEKRSGVATRPVLSQLLATLKTGDKVFIYKIDRLARSLIDLLGIVQKIEAAGASFQSLTEPIDTATGAGRMMVHMLGAFAEFERGIIRERCMAGQNSARQRGVHCGRPRGLASEVEADIVRMYESGWYTLDSLAYVFECHPSTVKRAVYRVLKPGHSSLL